MLQGMGMLEVPWLAVELREWFAVTRSTFLILSVSMPCGIILVGDLMNLYEYEDHSLQKLAQRLHHLSDTEVGSGFISLSSRERFPLPFSISIIRCCNIWWRYNPGHGLSFIEAPKRMNSMVLAPLSSKWQFLLIITLSFIGIYNHYLEAARSCYLFGSG